MSSDSKSPDEARLRSRPRSAATRPLGTGLHRLGLHPSRDSYLFVPDSLTPTAPLVVMLHGAGGHAQQGLDLLTSEAERYRFALLAPTSATSSWDFLGAGFGPDVAAIDQGLEIAFGAVVVDPANIAIAGFSDGASYALSLGISNGDLFHHLLAFSPGFVAPAADRDAPRIFVSHGRRDTVLPIDRCGRRVASLLGQAGFDVEYEEFDDGHTIPAEVLDTAMEWFLGNKEDTKSSHQPRSS